MLGGMEKLDDKITVRLARPEDRGAVLAFCVNTFHWGDYLPEVWDHWLTDPSGRLLVAEMEGLPVGIQHVLFLGDGEVWLQGLRVDPAVRRHGVANALFKAGQDEAGAAHARIVRLFTATGNEATHHMLAEAGFHLVVQFVDQGAPANAETGPEPEAAVPAELDELWRLAAASEAYRVAEGTYVVDWHCLALTRERLAQHVAAGEALVVRREGRPAALALAAFAEGEESLSVGGLFGAAEVLTDLGRGLRAYAARLAAPSVFAYLPNVPSLAAPLAAAGYASGREDGHSLEMDLFAKELPSP